MGAVLLQHGKVTAAARLFRNAITSDPFMSVAFLNLGNGESVTTLLQYPYLPANGPRWNQM